MNRSIRVACLVLGLILMPVCAANAADPVYESDAVLGVWMTEPHDDGAYSHIEVNSKDGKVHGRIYDPESGKEYRCKVTMKDPDTLEVCGYIKVGFAKLGRDTIWKRVVETE